MAAGLLLLFSGNVLPLMRSHLLGASFDAYAIDGAVAYWRDGWPLMALFVGLFVVVIPFVRSAMLIAVLGSLYLAHRGRWQGFAVPLCRGAAAVVDGRRLCSRRHRHLQPARG